MNKKIRDTPELNVPSGYEFEDMYETDDTGYGFDNGLRLGTKRIFLGTKSKGC